MSDVTVLSIDMIVSNPKIRSGRPIIAGTTLPVTLTWQAVGDLTGQQLTAFVHLLNSEGRVVAQEDHVPQRGERPTSGWLPGEVVADRYDLSLRADLTPGTYVLEIGLYWADGRRLRVSEPERWQARDSVVMGTVRIR